MDGYVFKACAIALLCAFCGAALGKMLGGLGAALRLGGICLIFGMAVGGLSDAYSELFGFAERLRTNEYAEVMLKALGISALCRISSDVCRDCGEPSLGGAVESVGRIGLIILAIPLVAEIIAFAEQLGV